MCFVVVVVVVAVFIIVSLPSLARNGGEGVTYFGGGIRAGGGGAPPLALAFVVVVVVAVDDFSVVLFPADGVAFPPYDIARSLSLFFTRRALPSSLSSSNAESLLSFPSLSFSFFLSLSRERETNNATPTTNFVRSFSFRRCSKRASNSIDNYTKRMRFRLSLLLLETRALHTKHQHHRKQKKCRRPVRRRLRRAEHSRFGSSSTFIPKGALKKDQKRVRWFRKDSSLLLCGKEREREKREREKRNKKKLEFFCVTDRDPKLTRGKKKCKSKTTLSRRTFFTASFFLSFFLSFFRCLDDGDDDDDDDDAPPVRRLFLLEARRRRKKHNGGEEEETTKKGAVLLPKVRTKHSAALRGRDDRRRRQKGVCTPYTL